MRAHVPEQPPQDGPHGSTRPPLAHAGSPTAARPRATALTTLAFALARSSGPRSTGPRSSRAGSSRPTSSAWPGATALPRTPAAAGAVPAVTLVGGCRVPGGLLPPRAGARRALGTPAAVIRSFSGVHRMLLGRRRPLFARFPGPATRSGRPGQADLQRWRGPTGVGPRLPSYRPSTGSRSQGCSATSPWHSLICSGVHAVGCSPCASGRWQWHAHPLSHPHMVALLSCSMSDYSMRLSSLRSRSASDA